MTRERKKTEIVFKILFIVMFMFFVLGSVVVFPVKMSIAQAEREQAPPKLLGRMFIPYQGGDTEQYSQIEPGSLVFFEDPNDKPVQEGIVVLYPTPEPGEQKNIVFPGYSMGMVATMNDTEGIGKTYGVMVGNDPNLALEIVSATSVVGVGSSTMKKMVNVFEFINSLSGLIVLVLLPFVLFVLFFVLFFLKRTKRKTSELTERETVAAAPDPAVLQNLSLDQGLVQQEPLDILGKDQLLKMEMEPKEDLDQPISHPVAPSSALKEPAPLPQVTGMNDMVIAMTSTSQETPPLQKNAAPDPLAETPLDNLPTSHEERDTMKNQNDFLDELRHLSQTKEALDEDAFLAKIESDLNQLEQQNDGYASMTNVTKQTVPSSRKKEAPVPPPQQQDEDNTIVFLLKDDEIDVKFNNLISKNIDVDYHKDGSGFLVKTEKYQADITVVVSEQ